MAQRLKFLHSDIVQILCPTADLEGRANGQVEPAFGTDAEIGSKTKA